MDDKKDKNQERVFIDRKIGTATRRESRLYRAGQNLRRNMTQAPKIKPTTHEEAEVWQSWLKFFKDGMHWLNSWAFHGGPRSQ